MAQKKAKKDFQQFNVEFGAVSFRKRVAAIGLKFAESDMPILERENFLKKAQVAVTLRIDKSEGSDVDGQKRFIETDLCFEGVGERRDLADVHRETEDVGTDRARRAKGRVGTF